MTQPAARALRKVRGPAAAVLLALSGGGLASAAPNLAAPYDTLQGQAAWRDYSAAVAPYVELSREAMAVVETVKAGPAKAAALRAGGASPDQVQAFVDAWRARALADAAALRARRDVLAQGRAGAAALVQADLLAATVADADRLVDDVGRYAETGTRAVVAAAAHRSDDVLALAGVEATTDGVALTARAFRVAMTPVIEVSDAAHPQKPVIQGLLAGWDAAALILDALRDEYDLNASAADRAQAADRLQALTSQVLAAGLSAEQMIERVETWQSAPAALDPKSRARLAGYREAARAEVRLANLLTPLFDPMSRGQQDQLMETFDTVSPVLDQIQHALTGADGPSL